VSQTNLNFITMGQWALSCKLQDRKLAESPGGIAAGEPPTPSANVAAEAPVDTDWDELSGSFPARPEHPEAPLRRALDTMELAVDQSRWVPSEVLQDTTCQQKAAGLSFRCSDKKTCPRCAAQHQVEGGYEDPVEYLSAAVHILESLEAYMKHPNYHRRREELRTSSYQWAWMVVEQSSLPQPWHKRFAKYES
jgi:hypothetical protein